LSIGLDANKIFEFCFDSKQNEYSINEMFLMLYFLSNISIKDIRKEESLMDSKAIISYNIVLSFNDIDYKYTYESSKHNLSFDIHKPKYDHILVDEVQDLQPIQIQILNGFHNNSMTIA
jgi:superfamily I DNA/RNA helicase